MSYLILRGQKKKLITCCPILLNLGGSSLTYNCFFQGNVLIWLSWGVKQCLLLRGGVHLLTGIAHCKANSGQYSRGYYTKCCGHNHWMWSLSDHEVQSSEHNSVDQEVFQGRIKQSRAKFSDQKFWLLLQMEVQDILWWLPLELVVSHTFCHVMSIFLLQICKNIPFKFIFAGTIISEFNAIR